MANTLTALAPVLYSAAQEVAKEPVGFLDAINMNFDDKGVALNDSVKVPVAPVVSTSDYIPAMTTTAGTDRIASSVTVSIDNSKEVTWHLTGEQQLSLMNGDTDKEWVRQLIAQGMRALNNGAESTLATAIYKNASRAVGTAGTTPFATNIDVIAEAYKILKDNGAPLADMQMVMDTSAGLNARNLAIIQQADQAGTPEERRSGNFLRQFGFQLRESAGVQSHTKGTGTLYDIVAAGEAVGQTTLSLEGGTVGATGILAGDVVTFAGGATDTNKYVVNTGLAATSGDIVIGNPGLRVVKVDADEMTIGNSYTANCFFERGAIVGVMRPPIVPASPLIKQIPISDGMGRTYLLCEIVGDGMVTWSLRLAYGFKVVQSEFVGILMG